MSRNLLLDKLGRRRALAAAYYFAISFRREHINAESQIVSFRIALHIKRFDRRGIVMHHHRPVVLTRKISLVWRTEIAAPLKLIFYGALLKAFVQHLHGDVVMQARKGRDDRFEFRS